MNSLAGKVFLITGASAGIGAGLARELGARGAKLVLTARRLDRLQALAAELSPRTSVVTAAADVTVDGDVESAVAAGVAAFGALDGAIANAGFGVVGAAARLTLADYRRQFETNFFGALRTTYAALPELRKTGGRLAFIGSVSGHVSTPRMSPYSSSKFALRGFVQSIHDELASERIAVTLISPGFVVSDIGRVDNQGRLRERDASGAPAWLRMPTDKAARQIIDAIAARRREAIITTHGKLLVWAYRHLPWVVEAVIARGRR
ncbi:MAG TPA: SDR family NAD(P)-dependent oxidoreductase [Polyangia bacterium]|jgi:short-subunit dehydrogenase|nr:SDR family NAD(P)-dependent oxidoreductase [Polyangia bacterium]